MKNILFIFLILLSVACSRQWPGQLTDTDMAPYADIAVTESARGSDRNALVDGDPLTYWTPPAELTNPIILFSFKEPVAMDKVVLREFKEGGNRVGYFVVEGYVKNGWMKLGYGNAIEDEAVVLFSGIRLKHIRVKIVTSAGNPMISGIEIFCSEKGRALAEKYVFN